MARLSELVDRFVAPFTAPPIPPGRRPAWALRKLLPPALVAGGLLLATAGAGLADPNLPDVAPHRHFIRTATGERVEVGPRLCDDPSLQQAFNEFHFNVHRAVAGVSQGPAAPGLHNSQGAELSITGC